MDKEQARIELNRRLNILSSKRIPNIKRTDLSGGRESMNRRKDIARYSKNINNEKLRCLSKLNELNNLSAFSGETEEVELDSFSEPSLSLLRKSKGRGYFW